MSYRVILLSLAGLACFSLAAPPALAYQGLPPLPLPGEVWRYWQLEPALLAILTVMVGLYGRGVWQLWQRAGVGQGIHYWQVAAFGSGIIFVLIAFISPLAALAGALFSAHMVQHLLLMIVAPPFLILGGPLLPMLWALPMPARRALGQKWKAATSVRYLWQQLTQPVTVWLLSVITLWLWHLPVLYQAALEQVWVHELEHFTFFSASLLFWWLVIQPHGRRRMSYGTGILFIFTTALQSGALGALLTFARVPLYPIYSSSVAGWNMTLLEDQQLAGLLMWIPSGIIYLIAALALLGAWLQSLERQQALQLTDIKERAKPV